MKNFFLGLLMSTTVAGLGFASENCEITVISGQDPQGNANPMMYSVSQIEIPKSCKEFKITMQNETGMPRAAFGHNIVVSKASDMQAVVNDGIKAGLDSGYLKEGDERVIAATELVGGKDITSTVVDVSKLKEGTEYKFFCTFPGHLAMMQGGVVLK